DDGDLPVDDQGQFWFAPVLSSCHWFEKICTCCLNDSCALATGRALSALLFVRERRAGLSNGLVEDVRGRAGTRVARRSGGRRGLHGRHGPRSLELRRPYRAKPNARTVVRVSGNPHWRVGVFIGDIDPRCEPGRAASHRVGPFAASTLADCVYPAG